MADTNTTHYNLVQPQVGGSFNTWGNKINNDLAAVDSLIYSISAGINQGLNASSGAASDSEHRSVKPAGIWTQQHASRHMSVQIYKYIIVTNRAPSSVDPLAEAPR